MASKSFKDYYIEDKTGEPNKRPSVVEQQTTLAGKADAIVSSPVIGTTISPVMPMEDITLAVKEILVEQRNQSKLALESVTKVNEDIAVNITRLVESSNETNNKLLEAIVSLSQKVEQLEGRIDEIKHLEIPTPIVNLQMPSKRTIKKVHRDAKGVITHIEESESFEGEGEGDDDSAN